MIIYLNGNNAEIDDGQQYFITCQPMSYIIDKSRANQFFNFSKKSSKLNPQHTAHKAKLEVYEPISLGKQLMRTLQQNSFLFLVEQLALGSFKITLEPIPLCTELMTLLHLRVEETKGSLVIEMELLWRDRSYYCVGNNQQRKLLNRLLLQQKKRILWELLNVQVSLKTGRIRVTLPLHIIWALTAFQSQSYLQRRSSLTKLLAYALKESSDCLDLVFQLLGSPFKQQREPCELDRCFEAKTTKLHRYYQLVMVQKPQLDNNQLITEHTIRQNKQRQQNGINKILKNRARPLIELNRVVEGLYQLSGQIYQEFRDERDYYLANSEQDQLRTALALPLQPSSRSIIGHNALENFIFIKEPEKLKFNALTTGGFSTLAVSEMHFWQASSSNEKGAIPPPNCNDKNLMRKFMVIKRDQGNGKTKKRNLHQKQILHKLRGSTSLLLTRFYIPINKPAVFEEDIVMDYIPFPNLAEYLVSNRVAISLATKVYLMFMLVQTLRCLKDYGVVHLDLKPSNILIYCNLYIKVIDFGESYHSDICKQGFLPGLSPPYSSPEAHRRANIYTYKNDLYSLGVIFYEMIYEKYPFLFHQTASLNKYKTKQYLNHFLCVPEENQTYGQHQVLPIINQLISRCLQPDPQHRPQLSTLALVLYQCLQIIC